MEEALRDLRAKMGHLGVGGSGAEEGESQPPPKPKVLEELTLEGVVKHIRKLQETDNSRSKEEIQLLLNCACSVEQKVMVMTGAGISTGQ